MGFLVMDEAFDVWESGKNGLNDYHLYFTQWAQTDLQDFVRRDRNHASVIMWSIGNEIPDRNSREGLRYAWSLADEVHRLDPTRPVTAAIHSLTTSRLHIWQEQHHQWRLRTGR